jgi:flagellum-specific peptidoglycan hydrolase FlgJ
MAEENGQVEEADMMEDSEIERKIAEQAKDSNKELGLPALDAEDGREDEEEDGEGGTSKASDPKAKKSNASPKKHEGKDEEYEDDDEEDEDEEKKEEIEVNVEEDVAALVDGEELSEAFKTKAATIFEAAVKSKISKIRKQIREESKKEQDERIESMQEEMTESMDKYLNYVAKEWMTENKLAVETGVRNEVTESFIIGLKKLFEEHYIDVPEEKEDVFESLVVEVAELEEKLDKQAEKHMDTVKELNTYKAASVFKTVSEGMVDTDVEKFSELTEDVDYDTDEQYAEKLNTIKNSYFKSDKKEDVVDNKKTAGTNNPVVDGTSDSRMDGVMNAISHLSKK